MATLTVLDKFTGEPCGSVPLSTEAEVRVAVARAKAAGRIWAETPAHRRSEVLRAAAEGLRTRREEIAVTICREAGKAWKFACSEVDRGIETFTFAAEEARRLHGETVPMDASPAGEQHLGFYLRVPLGVIAAITPFNFPLNLVAHKVAPALAAGNAVVLKPADRTPLTAVILAEVLGAAGLPAGVLTLVHGDGPSVGEWLVTDPRPAMVSFTGSPAVGARIHELAGLKRVALELGNNSGTIVEPDAALEQVVPRTVTAAFANAGQVCISLQRLYVHEAIAPAFIERFVAATSALQVGNPLDRDCDVGPMISDAAAERAEAWVREAVSQGAQLLAGGRREGRLFWPTVLTGTREDMKVMCDEVFAPVVSIVPYAQFEEALERLANTPYGLQAGLFTRDLHKAFAAVKRLDVGGVLVNDTSMYRLDHMPYGGNRRSGIGREGVRFAVEEMTNVKMVSFNLGAS